MLCWNWTLKVIFSYMMWIFPGFVRNFKLGELGLRFGFVIPSNSCFCFVVVKICAAFFTFGHFVCQITPLKIGWQCHQFWSCLCQGHRSERIRQVTSALVRLQLLEVFILHPSGFFRCRTVHHSTAKFLWSLQTGLIFCISHKQVSERKKMQL